MDWRNLVKFGGLYPAHWLRSEVIARSSQYLEDSAKPSGQRIALLSDWTSWCSDQQYYPFRHFRDDLSKRHGITALEFFLDKGRIYPPLPLSWFDVVLLKLGYRTREEEALAIARRVRDAAPHAALIYMDADDDLCIQWGEMVGIVDLYVKAQVFADRRDYLTRFQGKSNLHEHAISYYGHVLGPLDYGNEGDEPLVIATSGSVAEADLPKVMLGWNMATASDLISLWERERDREEPRKTVDCVFRGAVKLKTISGYQRAEVKTRLQALAEVRDIRFASERVSLLDYYEELRSSRICVSPFGFGELCWRDFEAVLCRSLLIKPDMSHLKTIPDIYQPYETYVPVRWDLSDLEEKCRRYLDDHEERQRITDNAFQTLDRYYRELGFAHQLEVILAAAADGRSSTLGRQSAAT